MADGTDGTDSRDGVPGSLSDSFPGSLPRPGWLRVAAAVAWREWGSYFATPVALVFIVVFLALAGACTFYLGGFFDRGQADLQPFFLYHPWLYLLFVPAVSMRLWAEERKTGTIENLMTLPVSATQAVIGKFTAAWLFTGFALALTFPMWITVNILGAPDNGVIAASYAGSFLMVGAFLAIGSCLSAMTRSQAVAFILAAAACFLFTMSGIDLVLDFFRAWAPEILIETVASFSFLTHFNAVIRGVIELRDAVYFASQIAFWLFANIVIVDLAKAR